MKIEEPINRPTKLALLICISLFGLSGKVLAGDVIDESEYQLELGNDPIDVHFNTDEIVLGSLGFNSIVSNLASSITIGTNQNTVVKGSFDGGNNGVGLGNNANGRFLTRLGANSAVADLNFDVNDSLTISGFGIKGNTGQMSYGGAIAFQGTYHSNYLRGANVAFKDNSIIGGDNTVGYQYGFWSAAGGAIFAQTGLIIDDFTNLSFEGNSASGGTATTSTIYGSGRGGAIYATNAYFTNSDGISFIANEAIGGTAAGSWANENGQGGAVYGFTSVRFVDTDNVSFVNNVARGAIANTSALAYVNGGGQGGAIYAGSAGVIIQGTDSQNRAQNYLFEGNQALGSDALEMTDARSSGLGGAIAVNSSSPSTTVAFSYLDNVVFKDNLAKGGMAQLSDAATWRSGTNGSGLGGAIYMTGTNGTTSLWTDINNLVFVNNTAQGGDAISGATLGSSAANSGQGGAVYFTASAFDTSSRFSWTDIRNFYFEGNQAVAGSFTNGSTVANSGLGGAMYISDANFELAGNGLFLNNSATVTDEDTLRDNSVALGGAIYYGGGSNTGGAPQTYNFNLHAQEGDIVFKGNTHRGGEFNSIYFGRVIPEFTSTIRNTIDAVFSVDDGHNIYMYDPMASQEDNFTDIHGNQGSNITVNVTKDGLGIWHLGGHNDMRAPGAWNIDEGTLHLIRGVEDDYRSMADIDLSAVGSSFTLANDASLVVDLNFTPSLAELDDNTAWIRADAINFEAGSKVYLNNSVKFFDFDTEIGTYKYLNLDSVNISNDADIAILGGTHFEVREYDYILSINANDNLSYDVLSKQLNPIRAGIAAVTGPAAVVTSLPGGSEINSHMRDNFLQLPENHLSRSVWATASYDYLKQRSGSNRVDFDVKTPGITIGVDRWLSDNAFIGLAGVYSRPDYQSRDADLEGHDITALIYGGATLPHNVNLSFFGGLGRTSLDQDRRVQGQSFSQDVDSDNIFLGVGLSKDFQINDSWRLSPFMNYEYLRADVDGWTEKSAHVYALKMDGYKLNIHRVKLGLAPTWQVSPNGAFVKGELSYQGLYGDQRGESTAVFINDPNPRPFRVHGDKLDRNMIGVGLSGGLPLSESVSLKAGYDFRGGRNTQGHSGYLNLSLAF